MAETEYSQENIAAILTRVENLEKMTQLSIAANPSSRGYIRTILEARANAPEFYLAMADGPVTSDEIIDRSGKSPATVSKVLTYLYDHGLIERERDGRTVLWRWHYMEGAVGISKVAHELVRTSP